MKPLVLNQFHKGWNANFIELGGQEVVGDYGHVEKEYWALRGSAGAMDLSFKGRICVAGADHIRFLNGQVTNDAGALRVGEGCYAALVTAKGRMLSDLNIYRLENELLLDFEPGLSGKVIERLEKYIIADDVQVGDVAEQYGLWSVQGPSAAKVVGELGLSAEPPKAEFEVAHESHADFGEVYLMNRQRFGMGGFDFYVPVSTLETVAERLVKILEEQGGMICGWHAAEMTRIEAGIPRFGIDMTEANLPSETGLENRAISYSKGCYIGQEVIARIRTYGKVSKALRGLRLRDDLEVLPVNGDSLLQGQKEVGFVTSAVKSPALGGQIALGYVRREVNQIGNELVLRTTNGSSPVRIVPLPFVSE